MKFETAITATLRSDNGQPRFARVRVHAQHFVRHFLRKIVFLASKIEFSVSRHKYTRASSTQVTNVINIQRASAINDYWETWKTYK